MFYIAKRVVLFLKLVPVRASLVKEIKTAMSSDIEEIKELLRDGVDIWG